MLRILSNAVAEAVAEIGTRPLRAVFAVFAVTLAAGVLVAGAGIAESGRRRVQQVFDERRPHEITVTVDRLGVHDLALVASRLPGEPGIRAAGLVLRRPEVVEVTPVAASGVALPAVPLEVMGVDAGALAAMASSGGRVSAWQVERGAKVAVIGELAARSLGIDGAAFPLRLDVASSRFVVGGVVSPQQGPSNAPSAVFIPWTVMQEVGSDDLEASLVVDTDPDLTDEVARRLPVLVDPHRPDTVRVTVAPFPTGLEEAVGEQVGVLAAGVAAVAALIGALIIANTTLLGVVERTSYIGVQRALGAGRADIAVEVVAESALLGLLGGAVGGGLGSLASILFALSRGWPPVADYRLVALVMAGSFVLGAVVGVAPAVRAASIPPAQAIRTVV